jgi:hypothetical protein
LLRDSQWIIKEFLNIPTPGSLRKSRCIKDFGIKERGMVGQGKRNFSLHTSYNIMWKRKIFLT